jgi:hypothetical protein
MQNQLGVLENGKDLFEETWKVTFVTFVSHNSVFEVDPYSIVLLDRIDSLSQFDHR